MFSQHTEIESAIHFIHEFCQQAVDSVVFNGDSKNEDLIKSAYNEIPIKLIQRPVIKINKQLEDILAFDFDKKMSMTIRFTVSSYDTSLEEIKVSYVKPKILSTTNFSNPQRLHTNLLISFTEKKKTETNKKISSHFLVSFTAKGLDKLKEHIATLTTKMPEKEIECASKKHIRLSTPPHPSSFWNTGWQTGDTADFYSQENDYMIIKSFKEFFLNTKKENFVIYNIGGGIGRDSKKILELIPADIKFTYIFIEPSNDFHTAKKYFDTLPEEIKKNIFAFNITLETFMTNHFQHQGNCIISSGGPINLEIASLEEAKKNIEHYQTILDDKGIVIITGLTPVSFTKNEFQKKYHFEVLKTVERMESNLHQCYVLKK